MTIKKLMKGCIAFLLIAAVILPVRATDDTTTATTSPTEGNEINTPAPGESINVTWCNVGEFATGYAINSGYLNKPSGGDSYLMVPTKSFISDRCFSNFALAKQQADSLSGSEERVPVVIAVGAGDERIAYAKYGVVYLNNTETTSTYSIYTSPNASTRKTYVNATSQRDALLIDMVGGEWAHVMMSGVSGYLKLTNSSGMFIHQIIPASFLEKTSAVYNNTAYYGYKLTRYGANPSDSTSMFLDVLRGTRTSNLVTSGNADRPGFMSNGRVYFSYDGHYFYETLMAMVEDARQGSSSRALNSSPYYNYYQYLPARAKTKMTGSAFDAFLVLNKPTAGETATLCYSSSGVTVSCSGSYEYKYVGPQSILYKNGSAFLQGQDNYGINAALIYVKATLEGAYGMSTISRAKFNPFGVNANDSSPFSSATKYASVYAGIESQFKTLMSLGYVNPFDGGGRYNGSHVGDKQSGINTLYASDPNWGFKLASIYRELDKLSGFADLNYYQLAVTTRPSINIYTSSSGSTVKQVMRHQNVVNNYVFDAIDMPLIIVEVLNNGRYKVVMDVPSDLSSGYYYAKESDYGYVDASDIKMINSAKSGMKDPKDVGKIIEDSATDIVTFDVPRTIRTTMATDLSDSYRSDITIAKTPIAANKTFVAIREVKTADATYYEVITDYTRAPARTKWIKANAVTYTSDKLVTTRGSSLNVRAAASTTAESKGVIASDRSALLYLESANGTEVSGTTTWYKVILDPVSGTTGYISGAFAVLGDSTSVPEIPTNPNYSNINKVKNLYLNQNPYLLGTGVIPGVNANDESKMTYVLQFTSGTTVFTHPLKTTTSLTSLTNDPTFNPNGVYNYNFAWYEGTIDFYGVSKQASSAYQSLPSGTYTLSIKATGGGMSETIPLINAEGLSLGGMISVDDKLSYQITQSSNRELSMAINNNNTGTGSGAGTGGSFDLTSYSTDTYPIYANSRVTWLKLSGSSLTIGGYALEQFVNYNKRDSVWREIIFISEDQSKAYRYPLTAIFDPYLNANKTLNPNGKFNYNYAYYKTTINLSKIQEYWTKKPTNLPSGNYRVFIRMSDGKRSNVMSLRNLKDEVVMPSSFFLIEGSNDVGFKR